MADDVLVEGFTPVKINHMVYKAVKRPYAISDSLIDARRYLERRGFLQGFNMLPSDIFQELNSCGVLYTRYSKMESDGLMLEPFLVSKGTKMEGQQQGFTYVIDSKSGNGKFFNDNGEAKGNLILKSNYIQVEKGEVKEVICPSEIFELSYDFQKYQKSRFFSHDVSDELGFPERLNDEGPYEITFLDGISPLALSKDGKISSVQLALTPYTSSEDMRIRPVIQGTGKEVEAHLERLKKGGKVKEAFILLG